MHRRFHFYHYLDHRLKRVPYNHKKQGQGNMGSGQYIRRIMAGAAFALCAAGLCVEAQAADISSDLAAIQKYGDGERLAYVRSGSAQTDSDTSNGLQVLQSVLTERISLQLKPDVVGLNAEQDSFMPFHFIYWPVTGQENPLSEAAQQKVQAFIDHGGLIMFDVIDASAPDIETALHKLLGGVNLGLLEPLSPDNALTSSFYKVVNMPGGLNNESVLIQSSSGRSEDVTAIIAGRRGWARAWAGLTLGRDTDDYKNALMATVNAIVFAYTGNYKTDQAKVQTTLDKIIQ
jgi:hypothetical protein